METPKTTSLELLPYAVSDAAWKSILPFLQASPNVYVGNPETCSRFLSAVAWIAKEGATWRSLPEVYGYWNSIYRRFGRWCEAGVFEALYEHYRQNAQHCHIKKVQRFCDSFVVIVTTCSRQQSLKTSDR